MSYREVERYYRQEHFEYYSAYESPFYAVTVEIDMTALKAWAARRGYSVYLSLAYFFTGAAASVEDFRYRLHDGRMVLYDRLHPGLTVPTPDGRFSFANLEWDPDPDRFHRSAAPVIEEAKAAVTLAESPRHRNYLYFTALPGVPFTGFTHATALRPEEAEPKVAFGRFGRRGDRLVVPIGIQVNHAFVDGRALGELVERVERLYAEPSPDWDALGIAARR